MSHLTPTHTGMHAPNNPLNTDPLFSFLFPLVLPPYKARDSSIMSRQNSVRLLATADTVYQTCWMGRLLTLCICWKLKTETDEGIRRVLLFSHAHSLSVLPSGPYLPLVHVSISVPPAGLVGTSPLLVPAARATLVTTIWWMSAWLLPPWHRVDGQVVLVPPLPRHPLFLITRIQ